jgi:hypothetical protein
MEIPESIQKEILRVIENQNSSENKRALEEAIQYIKKNQINIEPMLKIARESSFFTNNEITEKINSIKYLKDYIPDINIIERNKIATAQSILQNINFPLKNAESIITVNELVDDILIQDAIEFFDYLTNYPMLGYMHDVGKRIYSFIEKSKKVEISKLKLFRVRAYSGKRRNPYSILELIGPPFGVSTQNRFNNIGTKVSYFSDDLEVLKKGN